MPTKQGGLGRAFIVVACVTSATVLAFSASGAHSEPFAPTQASSTPPPALAVVIELPAGGVGEARLATLAGVLKLVAVPRLKIAVYLDAGPAAGSELLFDQAPPSPKSTFALPRPKLPPDATGLMREAYTVALKKWYAAKLHATDATQGAGGSLVSGWASRRAGGLLTTVVRSNPSLVCSGYAASLYRAGLFFTHEIGSPRELLLIADLSACPPPSPRLLNYQLAGTHVVLAGLSAIDPGAFRSRSSAWRGFFAAEGTATPVAVLPHGLDTARAISKLLTSTRAST